MSRLRPRPSAPASPSCPNCSRRYWMTPTLPRLRSLRLGREFDVVLIHDAIMYATDPTAVRETLETAAIHCRRGGRVAVLPDHLRPPPVA